VERSAESQYRRIPGNGGAPSRTIPGRANKEQIMLRPILLASALLVLSTAGWAENNRLPQSDASQEDKACRADAHRFCRDAIPDEFRIASCLQEHRDRLTRACRAMLEGHGL
jgi:hypothetical protein